MTTPKICDNISNVGNAIPPTHISDKDYGTRGGFPQDVTSIMRELTNPAKPAPPPGAGFIICETKKEKSYEYLFVICATKLSLFQYLKETDCSLICLD
jgi:hypothetical protein